MTAISPNPDNLITTSQIADLVNEFFDLADDDCISQNTPHMWWYRSRNNMDIGFPMPAADATIGRNHAPLWKQANIVHWFAAWRDLTVPVCQEAGDRVDMRGREYPSQYRTGS